MAAVLVQGRLRTYSSSHMDEVQSSWFFGNWELGIGKKVSCTSRVRELLYIAELCQAKNFGYSVRLFSFYGPFLMVNRTYSIGLYRIETELSRFSTFIKLAEALFDQAFGLFTCIYFSPIQP